MTRVGSRGWVVFAIALGAMCPGIAVAEPRSAPPILDAEGRLPYVRTHECAPRQTSARKDFWELARAPKLAAFCDRLAQSEALLEASPQEAYDAATKADELLPGRAAPLVVQGRALSALARPAEAVAQLKKAKSIDPSSVEHPATLYAFAMSQRDIQDRAGAAESFRLLVTRVSLLPATQRSQALFEAASQVLALGGVDAANEAIAILRNAIQSAPQSIRPLLEGHLALALDRRGNKAEADSMALSAHRGGILATWLINAHPELLRALPEERLALTAKMREVSDATAALAVWESAAAAVPTGPWAAHARTKVTELKKAPATSRAPRPR